MSVSKDTCGKLGIEVAQVHYEMKTVFTKFAGWTIDNDSLNNKQNGEYLTSPEFHAFNAMWQMKIYPKGVNDECRNHVSFFLQLVQGSIRDKIKITVTMTIDGNYVPVPDGIYGPAFKAANNTYGIKKFFEYGLLVRHLCHSQDGTSLFPFFITIYDTRNYNPINFDTVLNNQNYSDVKFKVEGKDIYAHKVLLANKSNVFAAMFEHKMKENLEGIVEIDDVEYDVMLAMFRYIYTGTIKDIEKIAKPLLIAADKYGIMDLKENCGQYIEKHLDIENIKDCLDVAVVYNVSSLKHKAIEFIKSNASKISESDLKLMMESQPDIIVQVVYYLFKQALKIVSK